MNEIEIKTNQEEGQAVDQDFELLNEVDNLRKNTVSKEEYERLQKKNKELMKRLINGEGTAQEPDDPVDLQEIRKSLFGDNVEQLSNRDFWDKVLTLRHERLKNEGVDIFLPKGSKTRYTREDIESANKVDEIISQMIEDSKDNPQLFNVLFNEAIN